MSVSGILSCVTSSIVYITILNTTHFYVHGTRIVAEESTRYGLIEYFYDAKGVAGMRRNGRNYLLVRCVLGNVVEVIRQDGLTVARYSYDAWGNHTVLYCRDNMSHINPWRYRGKYQDRGTGLYYLNTRYYDPAIRRFINADNYMLVPLLATQRGGLNMYAYALNNPVMYVDPNGQLVITGTTLLIAILIGAAIGAAIGGTVGGITAAANGQNVIAGIFIGAAFGAIAGAGAAAGGVLMAPLLTGAVAAGKMTFGAAVGLASLGALTAFTTGAISGFGRDISFQRLGNPDGELDWQRAARSGIISGAFNVGGAAVGGFFNGEAGAAGLGMALDIILEWAEFIGSFGTPTPIFAGWS